MPLLKNCKFYNGVLHRGRIGTLITCNEKIIFQAAAVPVAEGETPTKKMVRSWKWSSLATYKVGKAPPKEVSACSEVCCNVIRILNPQGNCVEFLMSNRNRRRIMVDLNVRMGFVDELGGVDNHEGEQVGEDFMMDPSSSRSSLGGSLRDSVNSVMNDTTAPVQHLRSSTNTNPYSSQAPVQKDRTRRRASYNSISVNPNDSERRSRRRRERLRENLEPNKILWSLTGGSIPTSARPEIPSQVTTDSSRQRRASTSILSSKITSGLRSSLTKMKDMSLNDNSATDRGMDGSSREFTSNSDNDNNRKSGKWFRGSLSGSVRGLAGSFRSSLRTSTSSSRAA